MRSRPASRAQPQQSASVGQESSGPDRSTIAKGAAGAAAGAAAIGLVAAAVVKRTRRPRVLGVPVPRSLNPSKLDLDALKDLDLKKLAKQIGKVAERVENTSEDVRMASAQAKRMSKKLS